MAIEGLRGASEFETQAREASEKVLGVFAVREEFWDINRKLARAEQAGTLEAPEGHLFRIIAALDGAITTIHDSHKSRPWYTEHVRGDVVYAPRIDSQRRDGHARVTSTSWLKGPLNLPSHVVSREPATINNEKVIIDIVSLESLLAAHANKEILHHVEFDSTPTS